MTVAMVNGHVTENALEEIAGKSRLVPEGHGMLEVARSMGVCMAERIDKRPAAAL